MSSQHTTCPQCQTPVSSKRFCAQCRFPLMLIAGKYRLERVLEKGGFGVVYLARHIGLTLDALRVIKVITSDLFGEDESLVRFRREVELTAHLSQRNEHIVRIYDDFGEEPEFGHYYVMEYLRGYPLKQFLVEGQPLDLRFVFHIFRQICEALEAAHRGGIVHRDLKPGNIFLIQKDDEPFYVKILDFGIAKPLSDESNQDLTQNAIGTPHYMSPEQCLNEEVDSRSDIYAIGMLLYRLLTGSNVFSDIKRNGKSMLPILHAHISKPPEPLRQRRPSMNFAEGLESAVMRAIEKEPEKRYTSAASFWKALAPFSPEEKVIRAVLRHYRRMLEEAEKKEEEEDHGESPTGTMELELVDELESVRAPSVISRDVLESVFAVTGQTSVRDILKQSEAEESGVESASSQQQSAVLQAPDSPSEAPSSSGPRPKHTLDVALPATDSPPPPRKRPPPPPVEREKTGSIPLEMSDFESAPIISEVKEEPPRELSDTAKKDDAREVEEKQEIPQSAAVLDAPDEFFYPKTTEQEVFQGEPEDFKKTIESPIDLNMFNTDDPQEEPELDPELEDSSGGGRLWVGILLLMLLTGAGWWGVNYLGKNSGAPISKRPTPVPRLPLRPKVRPRMVAMRPSSRRLTARPVRKMPPMMRLFSVSLLNHTFRGNARRTGKYIGRSITTGKIHWRFELDDKVSTTPVASKGILYVGSYDTRLYAFDLKTGGLLWKKKTGGRIGSSPTVAGDTIYFGNWDRKLYALNRLTGAIRWTFRVDDLISSTPVVFDGKIYFGCDDHNLYAVDAKSGKLVWKYKTHGQISSSPSAHEGVVIFGSYDYKVYALRASTGKLLWSYKTQGRISSSPAIAHRLVYIGSNDRFLYALHLQTGELEWKAKTGGIIESSPAVDSRRVYVGSYDKYMYAFDAKKGRRIWRRRTRGIVHSSPALVGTYVYFSSLDGYLYAVSRRKGRRKWRRRIGKTLKNASPAIYKGSLYIGSAKPTQILGIR